MGLRREQYRRADDPSACVAIVRAIVIAKCLNQRAVVRRALRDYGRSFLAEDLARLESAERQLTAAARRAEVASSVDSLRGDEGDAASTYFGIFNMLLRVDDPGVKFSGRSRRPPLDPGQCLAFIPVRPANARLPLRA